MKRQNIERSNKFSVFKGFEGPRRRRWSFAAVAGFVFIFVCFGFSVFAQPAAPNRFEDRPIADVTVTFEGRDRDISERDQFQLIARTALGERYSTVGVREALAALYETQRISNITVEATETAQGGVNLRFIIRRKTQARRVTVNIGTTIGDEITEEDILYRLNLVAPGNVVTEPLLQRNADLILDYLRDRGYFRSEVTYAQQPLEDDTEVAVTFNITPNAQATIDEFRIEIQGFNAAGVRDDLALKSGAPFTREKLNRDLERIRDALRKEDFLAPNLNEPRVVFDAETNRISIELTGEVGAKVEVTVDAEDEKVGTGTQRRLLPVRREGTLDFSAIEEGRRRLETYFQEQGYFFAEVTPICSVEPKFTEEEASYTENETEILCSALSGAELMNRTVNIRYQADLNRRLRLVAIRIEGTDRLPIEEIKPVLKSQEASALGIIPFLGYGRGYTSLELLNDDRVTIQSLMRELGYRDAVVSVRQGVSPNGEDLIITFVVDEGRLTRIEEVDIVGNLAFTDDELKAQMPELVGKNLSRARLRNGQRQLSEFYANQGYYDAKISFAVVELPDPPDANEKRVKVVYTLDNEGQKVFINRILVNGNDDTKTSAIRKTINLRPNNLLRSVDIFSSEQNLYATDAFRRVTIEQRPAGENAEGRLADVIVNVEEQPPRLIQYGGGFSTDEGPFGFFDIRHFNLLGSLYQGGARLRIGQRQQLAQIDFVNPRFLRDGRNPDGTIRYAPLTFTAQYQRDSTVTRFFRSAFDRGTMGIVQRVDEEGNPIDTFGEVTGAPTLNRFTLSAETSRTISTKNRSILFARYRFEDVRLYNIESLLIRDLLEPDARIRISGFGFNFVRDTRENCSVVYTILDIIERGEPGEPCRYSPSDPTHGDYLTAEYTVSVPFLGANIGFHKFQGSYYRFYTIPQLKNTTLAGRVVLGLASVFSKRERFSSSQFPDLEGILPISERFFAGGSTTLRGFEYESAGPRVVIVPQGTFRNSEGEPVYLNPFTVPFGGNALAIVNLEARVPVSESVRIVPFYDGGNVFRRIGDIFNPPDVPPNDVFRQNLRALWSHTVGLGFRIKTPIGGEFAIDYGYLLNPPRFLIPQLNAPNAVYQVRQGQLHFRFAQAF